MKTSTITAVQAEIARARKKHPTCYLAALVEEVGEVAKAMMQEGSASERAREELVQVAATAIRLIEEPDPLMLEPVEVPVLRNSRCADENEVLTCTICKLSDSSNAYFGEVETRQCFECFNKNIE